MKLFDNKNSCFTIIVIFLLAILRHLQRDKISLIRVAQEASFLLLHVFVSVKIFDRCEKSKFTSRLRLRRRPTQRRVQLLLVLPF